MLLTIITFTIVLSLLVFVHEMGHFLVARKFGIKAEEFGFGFPPRAWGIYKSTNGQWKQVKGNKEVKDAKGTIYSINYLPLGGFVKIKGEQGEDAQDEDSFVHKKIWKRALVLSAGVIMNLVLAIVLISIGLMIGLPQAINNVNPNAKIRDRKVQIVQVLPNSPASKAGLKMGDSIVLLSIKKVNKQSTSKDNSPKIIKYQPLKISNIKQVQKFMEENNGKEIVLSIKRGDKILDKNIKVKTLKSTGKGGIGIALAQTGLVSYPWYEAIYYGIKTTFFITWMIIVAFYELLKNLILGHGLSADIAGPVGIVALTGQVARLGIIYILQFTALLSINLAVINFLPFPALDGGRVFFLLIEKLKGKPVKRELEALIHNIGFAALMILVVLVTFRDISRFNILEKIKNLF